MTGRWQALVLALLFLNNRYHDPTTGQFISVDPMVTVTGEPYVCGSANPRRSRIRRGMSLGLFMGLAMKRRICLCTYRTALRLSESVPPASRSVGVATRATPREGA